MSPLEILKKYWGYESFRPQQEEVVERIIKGGDTLTLMPTGAGKSILYQVPAMAMEGTCVVVTPLIALMKDQVDRLRRLGIPAAAIHSGMTTRQIDIALDNCVYGDTKFLYIAPERITSDDFRLRLGRMRVSMIAVDEAHCISQWGYDFRPSYLKIALLRKVHKTVPVLALTASATPEVAEDIMRRLEFRNGVIVRSDYARANLSYSVRHTEDKPGQLLKILAGVPGTAIVYVRTRDRTMQLASMLRENGVDAEGYHAGMGYTERAAKQDGWMKGRIRVMVATNAFGMGIDKADVRAVIHYDMCDSLEAYYQEAGRAGRDAKRAYAVLLVAPDEQGSARSRYAMEYPDMETIRRCYESIFNYLQIAVGDGKFASFAFNLHDFAALNRIYTTTALNCIKILQMAGYMQLTDELDNPARILFTVGRDELYKIRVERTEMDHFLRTLLRMYSGVFSEFTRIDENEIASVTGYTADHIKEMFKRLWQMRIVKYIPGSRTPLLVLTEERLPTHDVRIDPEMYEKRKSTAAARLEAIFSYAHAAAECRSLHLQRYFGQEEGTPCGVCDLCLARKKQPRRDLRTAIEKMVALAPLPPKEVAARIQASETEVAAAIESLLSEGRLKMDNDKLVKPE